MFFKEIMIFLCNNENFMRAVSEHAGGGRKSNISIPMALAVSASAYHANVPGSIPGGSPTSAPQLVNKTAVDVWTFILPVSPVRTLNSGTNKQTNVYH